MKRSSNSYCLHKKMMDINWAAPFPVANGIHIRSKTVSATLETFPLIEQVCGNLCNVGRFLTD
jgi:hypothetical protein